MAGPITISVLGDTKDLRSATRGATGDLTGLGKTSTTTGRIVKAGFLAMGAGALYAGKKLIDFTKAAAEDDAAQVKLAATLRKTTGATATQVAGVERWITKQGQLLGVTDDELRPALQRMAEGTRDVGQAQRMVSLAMDVSAGTGKSLKSVTEALLRAQNGSIGGLSRYGIATKDAEGNTLSLKEVTAGMAETFGGQATKAAGTAAGQYRRLSLVLDETGEAIGAKLLPYATDLAQWALNDGIPAAQKWWRSTAETRDELLETAGAVKDDLLPPLKTLAGVVGDVAGVLGNLPAPVRTIGLEAAAAALILPRLTGALNATKASAGGLVTNLRNTETRMGALRGAASTAAGVGGVLALTKASGEADDSMRVLYQTLGGAAAGFAIGGPIGALIGGAGAGLLGIWHAGQKAGTGIQEARTETLDFKGAIDATTGALQRQGREMILLSAQREGIAGLANRLGIAERDLIGAVNGNRGATRRLNAAYQERKHLLSGPESVDFNTWLRNNTDALGDQRRETTENAAALQGWRKVLKGLPPKVRTEVKAIGAEISAKQLRNLKRQYDLNPKQVQTIIKAIGSEEAVRKIKGVWQVVDASGRVKANLGPFERSLVDGLNGARTATNRGVDLLNQGLKNGTAKARPDLGPFTTSFSGSIDRLRGTASNGGDGIGSDLGHGINLGIGDWTSTIATTAYNTVAQAIREARRAADAHSPSRRTRQLGRDMGEGLERGLTDREKKIRATQRRIIDRVLGDLGSAIDRVKGRLDQLNDARASYVAGIADAAAQTANITTAGLLEDNTQTAAGIKETLEARLEAIRNFHAKVKQLQALGLKGQALRDLLAAGVDAGTVTAEALLAGGKDAVTDTVQLTNQIKDAATNLGEVGGREFYAAGIKAQAQLLKALLRDKRALDDAGRKIGVRIARAIRRELDRGLEDYDRVTGGKGKGSRSVVNTRPRTPIADRPAGHAGAKATTITLTPAQTTAIQRGRAIQLDLEAFYAAGGRKR